jgi:hypothetical protein
LKSTENDMKFMDSSKFASTWGLPILLLLVVAATPAAAFELTIQTANDPISNNDRPDDLYTAAFGVDVAFGSHRWSLGERMFTDRERNLRFDETFLEIQRDLPEWQGWRGEVGAGLLHVGHGLLGERAQNEVHRWVGSERVDLPYIDRSRWYGTFSARAHRPLWIGELGVVAVQAEAALAPGFQRSLAAGIYTDLDLGREFTLRAGLGARTGHAESQLLGDRIDSLDPAWELGVAWRDVTLRYSYNDRGTETSHLTLALRVGTDRRNRAE